MSLVLTALAVAHLAAIPQARPPVSPSPPAAVAPRAAGRITGIVKNAADGTPIKRARVIAASPALNEPRVVITGADGRYEIADLPAGSYTLSASRTGFAPFTQGQGRDVTGTPIAVAAGAQVEDVDLPLTASGVIVGRVLDEDGAPFAGASVDALITQTQNGVVTLFSVASAQSDDRGEFRLFGLAPGSYYVSAADPAFASVSTPNGVQHYSPTYYPGTPSADQARRVTVTGTGEPARIDIRLQLVPPAGISGRLTTYDNRQLLSGAILMTPRDGEGVPMVPPEQPEIMPDGRFSFRNVAPGHYQIRARGQTPSDVGALFASYAIEVFGNDVDGILMVLRPGAIVDGTVTFESRRGTRPPEPMTLRVRAPFIDGNGFGESLTGLVQSDGSYALRGVMKGVHQLVVEGLTEPWVLKSVRYRGTDITDLPLSVDERQQLHDVRIVLTDTTSEVTGVVLNPLKLPVANTTVLVCTQVPMFWTRTSRRLQVAYTDQAGRWTVRGLPPGEYFAVAAPMVDESDLGRHDRLEALQAIGTPFRLETADAREQLTLQLTPVVPVATTR